MESRTQTKAYFTLIIALVALCLLVINISYRPDEAHASDEDVNTSDALCRYGIAASGEGIDWVSTFRAGWYLNFTRSAAPADNGAQFVPVIHLSQPKDANGNYLDGYEASPRVDITDPNNPESLRYWLEQRPGSLWIVGNEVDRPPDPNQTESPQDDVQPDQYAEAYHDVYYYIKQYDPGAQVAISGLVQVTPSRLLYLDRFWEAYIDRYGHVPPVDAWTMHIYILSEVTRNGQSNGIAGLAVGTHDRPDLGKIQSYDPDGTGPLTRANVCGNPPNPYDQIYCWAETDNMDIFRQQVQAMRVWMKEHGQQNKPLLLSEYSLLPPYIPENGGCYLADEFGNCFTPQRVQIFMEETFGFLDNVTDPAIGYPLDGNRLVQQWLWYSVKAHNETGQSSDLVNEENGELTTMTQVGQYFHDVTAGKTAEFNLMALRAGSAVTHTIPISGESETTNAPIAATFLNNGNAHVARPISVTFYSNSGLTDVIGTATISPDQGVLGCAQRDYSAGIIWHDLSPGVHHFWAEVHVDDPGFVETNYGDNVVSGTVLVDPPYSSRLPLISP